MVAMVDAVPLQILEVRVVVVSTSALGEGTVVAVACSK